MANNLSLSELMSKPFVGELTEGEHSGILTAWTLVTNATDPSKEYIRMTFNVNNAEGHQEYVRNLFVRDMSIALSHIRRQLNRANEVIDPRAFLNGLRDNKTELKLWITYPIVTARSGAKRVQNLYFQPPITADETAVIGEMETPEITA